MAMCDEGYMVEDESSKFRFCQKDRTWTGKDAKCAGKECFCVFISDSEAPYSIVECVAYLSQIQKHHTVLWNV